MDTAVLARWRDAALIVLLVQAFLLGLFPAALLYRILRALPPLRPWLLPRFSRLRTGLCKVQRTTQHYLKAVAGACIWLQGTAAGLARVLNRLGGRRG
jgi:hypothetical protein